MINGAKLDLSNCILNATNDSSVQESVPEIAEVRFILLDGSHPKCRYMSNQVDCLYPSQRGKIKVLESNSSAIDICVRR